MTTMNRATRRAAAKAVQSIRRCTQVPGPVLAKLNRTALDYVATQMGREISANGVVSKR